MLKSPTVTGRMIRLIIALVAGLDPVALNSTLSIGRLDVVGSSAIAGSPYVYIKQTINEKARIPLITTVRTMPLGICTGALLVSSPANLCQPAHRPD